MVVCVDLNVDSAGIHEYMNVSNVTAFAYKSSYAFNTIHATPSNIFKRCRKV